MKDKTIKNINRVLADWNPIGVPDDLAIEEYQGYIPSILQSIENRQQLMSCLEDILVNKLEIGYDSTNKNHLENLNQLCDRLIQVYEKTKAPK